MQTIATKPQRLAMLAGTATAATVIAGTLLSALPFYPQEWKWLLAIGVGVVWFFSPKSGTALALLSIAPAVAFQAVSLLPIYTGFAIVTGALGPYGFLVVGAGAAVAASGLPMVLTLAVPFALAFGSKAKAVIGAVITCLLLEIFILVSGSNPGAVIPASSLVFETGAMKAALGSLIETSWLASIPDEAKRGFPQLVELVRSYARYPMLVAEVAIWAAAVATATSLRVGAGLHSAASYLVAPALVGVVLLAGYAIAPPMLGAPPVSVASLALGLLMLGALAAAASRPLHKTAALLGQDLLVSRSGAKGTKSATTARTVPEDSWAELAGVDDIRREVSEAIRSQFDPAENKSLRSLGIRPTKGVLLFGPPGTGKTKLARIIANQAGAAFYAVSGSDFASKWFGESEANLRDIFEEARKHRPSVLFFDELEAFLPKRSQMSRADAPEKRIVATFLANTDGVDSLDGVLLVGATNHPDMIDPAALRPGRFDKLVYVPPPGAEARKAIVERYLGSKKTSPDVDSSKLAAKMERFTGADIEAVVASAMQQAMRRTGEQNPAVTARDLETALSAIRPSVTLKMLKDYERIASEFGRTTAPIQAERVLTPAAVTWQDVAGLEATKAALREAVEIPLAHPELMSEYRVRPTKGVLLFGPPGCGKTFLGKVVANEAKAAFLHVKGPELLRSAVGQTEEQLRDMFIRAREQAPCVLFFDEIDAVAGARGTKEASSTQILTQLLTEMDGMEELKGVVVIAATNRPDTLDAALLRPGRFDRILYVPPPDVEARQALLAKELAGKPLAEQMDLAELAAEAEGFSAAEIASFCNAAAMAAAQETLRTGQKHGISRELLLYHMSQTPRSLSAETLAFYDRLRAQMTR